MVPNGLESSHSEQLATFNFPLAGLSLLLAGFVLPVNSLTCLVLARSRRQPSTTDAYILLLAACGCLASLSQPVRLVGSVATSSVNVTCWLSGLMLEVSLAINGIAVACMTFDGYQTVVTPLRPGAQCAQPTLLVAIILAGSLLAGPMAFFYSIIQKRLQPLSNSNETAMVRPTSAWSICQLVGVHGNALDTYLALESLLTLLVPAVIAIASLVCTSRFIWNLKGESCGQTLCPRLRLQRTVNMVSRRKIKGFLIHLSLAVVDGFGLACAHTLQIYMAIEYTKAGQNEVNNLEVENEKSMDLLSLRTAVYLADNIFRFACCLRLNANFRRAYCEVAVCLRTGYRSEPYAVTRGVMLSKRNHVGTMNFVNLTCEVPKPTWSIENDYGRAMRMEISERK
ncbi:unnamed protein product [Protopolystoma xenopodis]|uniref:G-protein coupled receptors family 1 profile domain-containing protein n=1 Tax=Protopolystoma xenopodis TaxID=117903 RepID=A0A448WN13_9PLAT|nr:unnamed protein product [Protopolystoma xenopodis]